MQAPLYNQDGQEIGTVELPEKIFGAKWNASLVKQATDVSAEKRRHPLAHTKGRGEVRGGGKKPWRQKGTGRARHGSIRSPLWRGGGVTFGPRSDKKYEGRISKKMKRGALFAALSAKVRDSECLFIDKILLNRPKTKEFALILKNFPRVAGKSVGIVVEGSGELERAARNLDRVSLFRANELNVLDILRKKYLFIPKAAVERIQQTFLK